MWITKKLSKQEVLDFLIPWLVYAVVVLVALWSAGKL